jgi:hypothetical protein
MRTSEFVAALQHIVSDSSFECIPAGDRLFELRMQDFETNLRFFLQFEPAVDPELVAEIHFTCMAGVIVDPAVALPAMLKMNWGGVMGTQYYFSVREISGSSYALLETRQWLDADADQDDLAFLLVQLLWMNPLFTRGWNYPQGVRMFFS